MGGAEVQEDAREHCCLPTAIFDSFTTYMLGVIHVSHYTNPFIIIPFPLPFFLPFLKLLLSSLFILGFQCLTFLFLTRLLIYNYYTLELICITQMGCVKYSTIGKFHWRY